MAWLEHLIPRTRGAFALGVGLAWLVLALLIVAGALFVRGVVREQIAHRDAEALYATTLMEQLDARNGGQGQPLESDEQIGFDAAVLASRLKGVLGIRFFDPAGKFSDSFPATIQPKPLDDEARRAVNELRPFSRFDGAMPLSEVFIYLPQFATGAVARVPALEVTVPLHRRESQKLFGAAQFIVEGQGIDEEYARLDRHLAGLASLAFVVAALLLGLMLWPAFRKVERLNRQLAQRNENLQRANEELALAARSAALGAVSAHLMHGLKNPLASLSQFVTNQQGNGAEIAGDDWQDAAAAARRMQSLVEQTLEVLGDARGEPAYQVLAGEVAGGVRERVVSLAQNRGVGLDFRVETNDPLSSRVANLVSLILVNLVENAIQATPGGRRVTVTIARAGERLLWRIEDEGPGFPVHLRERLFLPCRSTREGGSGLGLAISKQVADHLGATLELQHPPAGGCVFVLGLPLLALTESTDGEGTASSPCIGAA